MNPFFPTARTSALRVHSCPVSGYRFAGLTSEEAGSPSTLLRSTAAGLAAGFARRSRT